MSIDCRLPESSVFPPIKCISLLLITEVNAPLLSRGLIDYAERLHREFSHQPEVDGFLANLYRRRLLLLENPIPRYLEAAL